jgi:hypothetical protein
MTILDNSVAVVGSDGEVARQIARLRDVPRLYNFEFTLNDSLQKMCLVAVSEESAERLFYEIIAPAKPHIDSRGSSGVLDYIAPDLIKYYRRKLGTQLIDRYHAYMRVKAEQAEAAKNAEEVKNAAAKTKRKEQEREHSLNILDQTLNYIKRIGALKAEKETEQSKDFRAWINTDGNNQ